MQDLNGRVTAITARGKGETFGNTVLALENAVADAADRIAAERYFWTVAQDDAVIGASRDCATAWRQTLVDVFANPGLYAAVARTGLHPPHDSFDRALTAAWMDRLKRGGATLSGARRDRYLTSAHELVRLEDAFWRNLARARATIRLGRRTVEVDAGTYDFLRTEPDADAREAFYKAYNRRAAAANLPLLERAIALRDRMAHALGYESWAEYRLRATALGGYAGAEQFVAKAETAYAPGRPPEALPPWNLLRDGGAAVPASMPLDDALDAIGGALGIRFARDAQPAWSSSVATYDLSDAATQRSLGTVYVDLVRRPGKQTGAGAYPILRPRGDRAGAAAIVASWPAASTAIPGDRLVQFYRLAGRAVALLLPEVPYETLACVSPQTQQVVAAIFERFARSGAPPPRSMLQATALAQVDLDFGSSGSHVDTTAVWQRVAAQTFTPLYSAGTYPQVASDEFVDGDAGLLVLRPWGEVYAADAYATLAGDGRLDREAAQRFRRTVLAPGASRRFEDEMRDFLGHEPHPALP